MEDRRSKQLRIALTRSFIFIVFAMLFGYILNHFFEEILQEFSEIRQSDVIGVFGTLYTLITAFILVNVWQQFNTTSSSFAQENEGLIELWNYTEFLDDEEFSSKMKRVLIKYIDSCEKEFEKLKDRNYVPFTSQEFRAILKVVDSVKFNDPRDPIAFEGLINAYKFLSKGRSERIENCLTHIPFVLRDFYILTSVLFWFGYLIEGFESDLLYYIVLLMVTLISVFSYVIIMDLDTPLKSGMVQVTFQKYHNSKEYIEKTVHTITSK